MPDQQITIAAEVENLEEVKELRKELEKIKELKEEIKELEEDDDSDKIDFPDNDPLDIPEPGPKYPKKYPYFCENDDTIADTQFEV